MDRWVIENFLFDTKQDRTKKIGILLNPLANKNLKKKEFCLFET